MWLICPGYFFKLPVELRLQIYQLVLPTDKLFIYRLTPDYHELDLALLATCKQISKEAYPVFVSNNKFHIYELPDICSDTSRTFFNHVREMTVMWTYQKRRTKSRLNSANIRDLFKCSRLHTIHIDLCCFRRDEIFDRFPKRYQEQGSMDVFIEHGILGVLYAIPGIKRLVFEKAYKEAPPEFIALGRYMTAQIASLRSQG
jgi:hypothetical protein